MRRLLSFLVLLTISAKCMAQPGGEVTVSVSPTVAGLHYSATLQSQEATYDVSCSATGGPPGWLYHYHWSGYGLTFDDPHAPSTTARAFAPGRRAASCYVYAYNPQDPEQVIPIGSQAKLAVAIGGPLLYSVSEASEPDQTPDHDDNDSRKPWHIQYFDYVFPNVPPGAQPSRYGKVSIALSQPEGTTFTWSIQGPGTAINGTGTSTSTLLECAPTNGSGRGALKVRVTFNYTDPYEPGVSGSAPDD
jgi:hypothetical protein